MTPGEVYAFAAAQSERQAQNNRQIAWLTARLTGFAKVPDFDTCFPPKPVERGSTENNLMAFFEGLGATITRH